MQFLELFPLLAAPVKIERDRLDGLECQGVERPPIIKASVSSRPFFTAFA